ncbi:hypothetical protein CHF27_000040 [Romboutsia maritimum]|uniref:DUF5808 domain-containing protein n=1 Tax=Romboutsia maritimum TaxID=2020948 RepID=A0A371IVY0_9FIRM|nr:DUF5808 domain-containing protein [Romboutsia maritimum]RDY24626.1 hypothetical protein CHF27_000040 [Romboutsia maritimum]
MSKTASLLLLLPNLIIIYLLFYNMQFFTGKKQFYGVSIKKDYIDIKEFKNLDKRFKSLNTLGFIIIILSSLILIYKFEKVAFASSFPILMYITYNFFIYVNTHNKVKLLKHKLLSTETKVDFEISTKSVVDVTFLNERNTILKKFKFIYLIPNFILFIFCLFAMTKYNNISNSIPIHWSLFGIADNFIEKSISNVSLIIGSLFLINIVISVLGFNSIKSRIKIDTENITESRLESLKYLNKIGFTFLVLLISIFIMSVNIIASIIFNLNLNTIVSILSTLLMFISSIYLIIIFIKSPNLKSTSSFSPDDDEKYWIWGSIYNNPNDPSFMVQKKFGIGWTINLATSLGKVFFIITGALLIWAVFITFQTLFI